MKIIELAKMRGMEMTREELECHLGKKVQIRLFDDELITGILHKTGDEAFRNNPNLYLPRNEYFVSSIVNSMQCISCLFKVSHIKSLKQQN